MKNKGMLSVTALGLVILLMSACSTSRVANPDGGKNVKIAGTWTVQNVDIEGISKTGFKVTVFDDAPYTCFVGSQWNLVANGNGSYSLPGGEGCSGGERTIFWGVQTENGIPTFMFKKMPGGVKPKNITDGYKMAVKSVSSNSLVLQDDVYFEGKTVYINYTLTK